MSTQRREVRSQRFISTKLTGIGIPTSLDVRSTDWSQSFRRVADGLTALATNSLRAGSRCEWRFCHGYIGSWYAGSSSYRSSGMTGSSPASSESVSGFGAGFLPEQLPSISPLLVRVSPLHSALPQVPMSMCSGTERQHGQGNLYLQHTARNTACDSGRRSARRDLLRA